MAPDIVITNYCIGHYVQEIGETEEKQITLGSRSSFRAVLQRAFIMRIIHLLGVENRCLRAHNTKKLNGGVKHKFRYY